MNKFRMHILVCGGTGCISSESQEVYDRFVAQIRENKLQNEVQVLKTGCFGFCEQGPIVKIYPDNIFYVKVTGQDVQELIAEHVIKGRIVDRLLYVDPIRGEHEAEHRHIPFYKSQIRIALKNCGIIDPDKIDDYIAVRGYEALGDAITSKTPQEVIDIIKASNLRGRGGAGFPTGTKFRAGFSQKSDIKYMVCNADEGDPGAFMDRSVIEGDPHCLIEGMIISAYAIGAQQGYVYIRAEYPIAIERLKVAFDQARAHGLLGKKLFGTNFNFDLEIRIGAGAFVCGDRKSTRLNSSHT